MSAPGHAVFSHGLESGPQARKVQALASIATDRGWRATVPDYRGMDLAQRVKLLLSTLHGSESPIVLIGSSMGAAVSISGSLQSPVAGLFLLAPAVFLPGYEEVGRAIGADRTCIVHGWRDEVVAPDHAIALARMHRATLHLYDDGHRLAGSLPAIEQLFRFWLNHWSTG